MSVNVDELTIRAILRDELTAGLRGIQAQIRRTNATAGNTSGLDRMNAGVNRILSSGGRMIRMLGGAGVRAAGLFTGALVGVATAATVLGIKTAADMETAQIAFETMLGSGEKAKAFLDDLKAFAASTPFAFPELQDAASKLIAAGVETSKVIPIMTQLGNATSGMGTGAEGIQMAVRAIQQLTASGKVQLEDLNQLRDAGIPVYDLLSAALGKSKTKVAELAAQGKLGKDALDAMMGALENGDGLERFAGLMEKQSASLSGTWSTLQDTVQMGLADAFQPAIPILKDLNLRLSDAAVDGIPVFQSGIRQTIGLGERLQKAYARNGLDGVVNVIQRKFGIGLHGALDKVREIGDDVATVFSDLVVPVFEDLNEATGGLLPLVTGLDDSLSWLADHSAELAPWVTAIVAGFVAYAVAVKAAAIITGLFAIAQGVYAAGLVLQTGATGAAATAQWSLNAALLANPIGLVVVAIGLLVAGFVIAYKKSEQFREIVDKVVDVVKKFPEVLLLVLGPLGWMAAGLIQLYRHSESFRTVVDAVWSALKSLGGWIASNWPAAWGAIKAGFEAWWNATKPIRTFWGWLFDQLIRFARFVDRNVIPTILKIASGFLDMASFAIDAFTFLYDAALGAFEGILSAADKGLSWIPGIGDKIKGARAAFAEFRDSTVNSLNGVKEKVDSTARALDILARPRSSTITVNTVYTASKQRRDAAQGVPAAGDTATSRAIFTARTGAWEGHARTNRALGGGYAISNMWVGGGGHGVGSGDHQKGRAIDVVGPNLYAYASEIRAGGGYAAVHGQGAGKHVHAVPAPVGDTATPRYVSAVPQRGRTVIIGEGAVKVIVEGNADARRIKAAVKKALEEIMREAEELVD